jgi:hypothetical protein
MHLTILGSLLKLKSQIPDDLSLQNNTLDRTSTWEVSLDINALYVKLNIDLKR